MNRRTTLTLAFSTLVIASLSLAPVAPAGAQSAASNSLRVQILGVRSDRGRVLCSLFDLSAASDFPVDVRRAVQRSIVGQGRGHNRVCTFEGVRPGRYAVSVLHDEDSNGELNTNLFGAPQEGWGVSNDAEAGTFSPPSYAAARFSFDGARPIQIHLRY